jgi:hypothetical protein
LIHFLHLYLWKTFSICPHPHVSSKIRHFAKLSANIFPNSADLLDFPKKRCYNRTQHYIYRLRAKEAFS